MDGDLAPARPGNVAGGVTAATDTLEDSMSRSALSLRAFGAYLLGTGALLVFAPNVLLELARLPQTGEVWIRVLGVVVFNVGIFYLVSAELNHRALYKASVYCRFLVMAAFLAFVGLGFAAPTLLIFGAIDVAGAVWTLMALLSDRWADRVVTQS